MILSIYKELQTLNTRYPTDKWTNELNRKFSEEEIQITIWKKCSTSLATRTALRFHLTPVRMGNIKRAKKNNCRGNGGKDTLLHSRWGWKLGGALWKPMQKSLKKLNTELPWLSWAISRNILEGQLSQRSRKIFAHPRLPLHCSPRCPQQVKEEIRYTHNGILVRQKEKLNDDFWRKMGTEDHMLWDRPDPETQLNTANSLSHRL